MAPKRHGKPDENYIHDERSIDFLNIGVDLSYVPLFKSFLRLRKCAI
jgi:hypothetical protein